MKTRILKVPQGKDPGRFTSPDSLDTWEVSHDPSVQDTIEPLREAATLLQQSDIPVAFPTETVYGLGADATRSAAVKGIYAAKGRPSDNPLIVHVSSLEMLSRLVPSHYELSSPYSILIKHFWPGPLSLLFPVNSQVVPAIVTAGHPKVAVRMPSHPVARALIALSDCPFALLRTL